MTDTKNQSSTAGDVNKEGRIRLEIPSHPRYVSLMRDFVYRFCLKSGFRAQVAFDMKIVTGEAMSNITRHAYKGRTDQSIFLEMILYPAYLELRFRDFGVTHHPPRGEARDLADYRERGLGLFLISQLTDYHVFEHSQSSGNVLILKKRRV